MADRAALILGARRDPVEPCQTLSHDGSGRCAAGHSAGQLAAASWLASWLAGWLAGLLATDCCVLKDYWLLLALICWLLLPAAG